MCRIRCVQLLFAGAALAAPLLVARDTDRAEAASQVLLAERGATADPDAPGDPAAGWTVMDVDAIEEAPQMAPARHELAAAVSEVPAFALLAAGLALGLARGPGGVRRPVRRRPG